MKIEVNNCENLLYDHYDEKKQIFYSDFNDEPMFQKINESTICLILTYLRRHHSVETGWEECAFE